MEGLSGSASGASLARRAACRLAAHHRHPKHADRPGDILDLMLAEVLEREVQLVAHLVAGRARDADAARRRQRFDARRHVNAVAVDVVAHDDDVADVDADAEHDAPVLRNVGVSRRHRALDFHGALHRLDHAGILDEQPVAHLLDDAAAVLRDRAIDQRFAVRLEARQRADLIDAHEPAIAHHIGGQDGGQPALDTVRCHGNAP